MAEWASIIDNVVLTLGFGVLIGSMILPAAYKNILSMLINGLMSPLTAHAPFYAVILVVAAIVSTVSTLVFKYKIDGRLMKQLSERSVSLQKRLKEAQLSGNKEKLKKLEAEQLMLLQDQSKLSIKQLKAWGYTGIVSLPLLMWINWYLGNQHPALMFSLPFLGTHAYTELFIIAPFWGILFTLCSIAVGSIIRKAINPMT